MPSRTTIIVDEAYIEYQTNDDPDATLDLLAKHPNVVLLRTFSKCHGLAGLRVGYALCSPQFRAAVDAVRQPFSVNTLAQAAAAEAIRHQDDVADRVERNLIERVFVEDALHELGFETAESQTNFAWIELGDLDEGEVVERLTKARRRGQAGHAAGRPRLPAGHLRDARRERALPRRDGRDRGLNRSPIHKAVCFNVRNAARRAHRFALRAAPRFLRARISTSGDLPRRPARGCH